MERRENCDVRSEKCELEESRLPGDEPHAYAIYVDNKDKVWEMISNPRSPAH
jgi:streptogramin lyase